MTSRLSRRLLALEMAGRSRGVCYVVSDQPMTDEEVADIAVGRPIGFDPDVLDAALTDGEWITRFSGSRGAGCVCGAATETVE